MNKWVFDLGIVIFIDFISSCGDFWPILGDIGPFLRPDLGGKLGYGYQLQIYINQDFLEQWEDIQSRFMLNIFHPKPFLCREAIEERTFAGHFWELWSSDFSVIFLLGSRDLLEQDHISL
jgi:hypothetical protein